MTSVQSISAQTTKNNLDVASQPLPQNIQDDLNHLLSLFKELEKDPGLAHDSTGNFQNELMSALYKYTNDFDNLSPQERSELSPQLKFLNSQLEATGLINYTNNGDLVVPNLQPQDPQFESLISNLTTPINNPDGTTTDWDTILRHDINKALDASNGTQS